ncbi:MAG TPA: hypothetical protein VEA81_05325 [Burkholderiaceae bacterium]|nr:hypothetical protein [Burkholderiaceae bacterium]
MTPTGTAPRPPTPRRRGAALACAAALLALGALAPQADAAERRLRGEAPFKVPPASTLAALPASSPFGPDDVRAGTLAFEIAYDDATPDADPDPYVGRYDGGLRAFRVRVGGTWVDLPLGSAELRVSDGGAGMAHRESLSMTAAVRYGAYELRVGWVQVNQAATDRDLRGAAGGIARDALPPVDGVLAFPTSGEWDRMFFVRLDPVGDLRSPVLYLNTSALTVAPAARPDGRAP